MNSAAKHHKQKTCSFNLLMANPTILFQHLRADFLFIVFSVTSEASCQAVTQQEMLRKGDGGGGRGAHVFSNTFFFLWFSLALQTFTQRSDGQSISLSFYPVL